MRDMNFLLLKKYLITILWAAKQQLENIEHLVTLQVKNNQLSNV